MSCTSSVSWCQYLPIHLHWFLSRSRRRRKIRNHALISIADPYIAKKTYFLVWVFFHLVFYVHFKINALIISKNLLASRKTLHFIIQYDVRATSSSCTNSSSHSFVPDNGFARIHIWDLWATLHSKRPTNWSKSWSRSHLSKSYKSRKMHFVTSPQSVTVKATRRRELVLPMFDRNCIELNRMIFCCDTGSWHIWLFDHSVSCEASPCARRSEDSAGSLSDQGHSPCTTKSLLVNFLPRLALFQWSCRESSQDLNKHIFEDTQLVVSPRFFFSAPLASCGSLSSQIRIYTREGNKKPSMSVAT